MNTRPAAIAGTRGWWRAVDLAELAKLRLTALVMLTTWVGYDLASTRVEPAAALHTLLGVGLVCGGANALNQIWERELDARMRRTQARPLPAGRMSAGEALVFALSLALAGLLELAYFANALAVLLALLSLGLYLCVYTPLKRRTWACTMAGAVPGALPPVIGWAAASGGLAPGAAALFAISYAWQLPHFYAFAWMFRDDYARAGLPMLPVHDPSGNTTSSQILCWTAALLPLSSLPLLLGLAGPVYTAGALGLGLAFFGLALSLARHRDAGRARRVFLGSLVYLPVLLVLLLLDARL